MGPTMVDPGLSREQFSVAVATQYLVWGLAGPIAGLLADAWGARRTLAIGGLLYCLGFISAGFASGADSFWWSAGLLIGLGIGGASFGVVHAVVARAYPPEERGTALGIVGAMTALGQLVMLIFTDWSISAVGWREALIWHGVAVALIVLAARFMKDEHGSTIGVSASQSLAMSIRRPVFWLVSIPFAFSGFQVMATMTHLPAVVTDMKLSADVALYSLIAVSATAFVGSWTIGRLSDKFDRTRVLASVYAIRAVLALVLAVFAFSPMGLIAFFMLVGLFWMSPIPLTSAICAHTFGTERLASIFSFVFFFHQLGGFTGTWLAAVVRDLSGSYSGLWYCSAAMCGIGAGLVLLASKEKQGVQHA